MSLKDEAAKLVPGRESILYVRRPDGKLGVHMNDKLGLDQFPRWRVTHDDDGKQRRALIVDDEHMIVEVLSKYLQDEGFAVTGAFDGAAGLKAALSDQFDVILLGFNNSPGELERLLGSRDSARSAILAA